MPTLAGWLVLGEGPEVLSPLARVTCMSAPRPGDPPNARQRDVHIEGTIGELIDGVTVLVVRGDELDPEVLADDAFRFPERFDEWGRYGISAFYAGSDDDVDALCQSRLVRFETVVVFERTAVEASGVDIVATFRAPHITLCHADLAKLVALLMNCRHRVLTNPYYGDDER